MQFSPPGHPARPRRAATRPCAHPLRKAFRFGPLADAKTGAARPQSRCGHRQGDAVGEFQSRVGDQFGIGASGPVAVGGLGGPARRHDGDFAQHQTGVSGGRYADQSVAAVSSGDGAQRVDGENVQRSGRCPHRDDALLPRHQQRTVQQLPRLECYLQYTTNGSYGFKR